jgi:hypothetical protein
LSEISSAGLIYLAAICASEARRGSWPALVAAGALAALGSWTRLNNLPMALSVAAFAWPLDEPIRTLWRPREWFARVSRRTLLLVPAAVTAGMLLFAARTWYYTGMFSMFHGTQGSARAVWRPEMSVGEGLRAVGDSLLMVITTSDPPHYHNGALPVALGAAASVAALTGVGLLGRLPLAPVLFCLAGFAGAVVARGSAYTGRFSVHVIGSTAAVLTCAIALAFARAHDVWRGRQAQEAALDSARDLPDAELNRRGY